MVPVFVGSLLVVLMVNSNLP